MGITIGCTKVDLMNQTFRVVRFRSMILMFLLIVISIIVVISASSWSCSWERWHASAKFACPRLRELRGMSLGSWIINLPLCCNFKWLTILMFLLNSCIKNSQNSKSFVHQNLNAISYDNKVLYKLPCFIPGLYEMNTSIADVRVFGRLSSQSRPSSERWCMTSDCCYHAHYLVC